MPHLTVEPDESAGRAEGEMGDDLTIPATRALLEGWCGPVLVVAAVGPKREELVHTGVVQNAGLTRTLCAFVMDPNSGARWWCPIADLRLDLARTECWDRVCRVMAERTPRMDAAASLFPALFGRSPAGSTGGTIGRGMWALYDGWSPSLRYFVGYHDAGWRREVVVVPALSALDPSDDTRLPSGLRRVDVQALRAVWMQDEWMHDMSPNADKR